MYTREYTPAEISSQEETMKHIRIVSRLLNLCMGELRKRALSHDTSKLQDPELPIFAEHGPKLRELLLTLPRTGPLFPKITKEDWKDRAAEFSRPEISAVSESCSAMPKVFWVMVFSTFCALGQSGRKGPGSELQGLPALSSVWL